MFNDVININEIEIKNSLLLNESDYDEIKSNLEHDYNFLQEINNIYPIIHLFIGDETESNKNKLKNGKSENIYNENSILGDITINNNDEEFGLLDMLGDMTIDNLYDDNQKKNDINELNSLFDKEYYSIIGNDIRTIKIYFTNLFRKDCELNKGEGNIFNKINSSKYCEFLQGQLINYLDKQTLFEDDKFNENDKDNK